MALGDVKIFDMVNSSDVVQTDATLAESSYTRVTGTERKFGGMMLIDNGLIRVAPWNVDKTGSIGAVPIYGYVNGAWRQPLAAMATLNVEGVSTSGKLISMEILVNTPSIVKVKFTKHYKEDSVDKIITWSMTVRRGLPTIIFETTDLGWSHIHAGSTGGFFYYSANSTLTDNSDSAETKTETWGMQLIKGKTVFQIPIFTSRQKCTSHYSGLRRTTNNDLKHAAAILLPLQNSDQIGTDSGMWHLECENNADALSPNEQGTWTATADAAASAGDMLTNGSGAASDRKNFRLYLPFKGYYRLGIQARNENVASGHDLEVIVNEGGDVVIDTIAWNTANTNYELKLSVPYMFTTTNPIIGLRNKSTNTTHTWKLDDIVIVPLDRTKDSPPESMFPAEFAHEPLAGVELVATNITND